MTTVKVTSVSSVKGATRMSASIEASEPTTNWVDDFDLVAPDVGDHPTRRRRRLRWVAIPVVALLIAAAALWVANPFGTAATSLVTAQSTTGTVVSSVSISGSVASATIDELSFGTSGTVSAVNVVPGDTVTAGQVLATIDSTALQGQLATAEANLVSAKARLTTDQAGPTAATKASARDSVNQAVLQLSTARQSLSDTYAQDAQSISHAQAGVSAASATLAADKASLPAGDPQIAKDQSAVSTATSDLSAAKLKATLAVHQAENQVNSASLGVTAAQDAYNLKIVPTTADQIAADKAAVASATQALTTLQQTGVTITSPAAGTVAVVSITVGQQVSGSSAASSSSTTTTTSTGQIEVMDLGNLQISGQASETDISKLKLGQPATITAAALGSNTVVGKVTALGLVGTQISGVTSYPVTVSINGTSPSLLVGMSATAAIVTNRADDAVLVPSLAVKTVGGQQVVAVLGPDGKTQTNTPVQVGITNGSQTQIVSGLSTGATVVESLSTTTTRTTAGGAGGTNGRPTTTGAGGFGG
jgi:multidrug efflux pump subunit AcrA (membrane-fusion protein)